MFSIDAPKVSVDDPRQVGDVIRLVVSGDDPCVVDHPMLLAGKLPLGTAVTGSLQNDWWNVQVSPADQSVALSTRGGEPLLNLRVQGTGPCVLRVEVPSGVQVWGLGQCFADPDARVDWIGHRRTVADHGVVEKFRPYGHGLQSYVAGTEGYIQIPILMVAGGPQPFAIVLDCRWSR